jgi:DNA gyrase/topoisomerase IV subunit B
MAKKIEEKFKKLTDIDHMLLRPGMYVGSIKPHTTTSWVLSEEKMVQKELTYNPGFLKLFDEILLNSVDESKREATKLNTIKVNIENGRISVWDNGGIPVVKHKEHNEWIPEMIFSNLKAGSNFNDDESRSGAGLNGVGSVITNIFSKEFRVSTCDGKNKFNQTFSNNMRDRTKPSVTKSTKNHTEISYIADVEKFGMTEIDEDNFKMLEKRVYDVAACNSKLKIYFNDKLISIKSFEDYIKLYTDTYFYESKKDKSWSIGIAPSDSGFKQISFANSTDTYDGGTHLDYVLNQIISSMRAFFNKKYKVDIKPSELKNHMFVFLDSTIVNPSFSSQTKEKLITEVKDFGSTFEISDKLINSILKSEIVQSVLDWIEQKKNADENRAARELNKNLAKIKVDKLIDAKGKDRWKCSLALFEGDCLHEDTRIRIIRDGDIIDEKIKNLTTEDLVITHNNTISNIYALTKKIKKQATIKIKDENISCSHDHKWFIYDTEKNEFYFELTKNIKPVTHKLVKNYLAFTNGLISILESDGYTLKLLSGDIINTNPEHKFAVYNINLNKFEMVESSKISPKNHYLVNTFKL